MNKISISYTKNSGNKYDYIVKINNKEFYTKKYSPKIEQNQHLLSKAMADYLNEQAQNELKENPDFTWKTFSEYKEWASSPAFRKGALSLYEERQSYDN